MRKKLGFRDLHKIISDTRGEAERQVKIAIAGEKPDAANLKAFFGAGSDLAFTLLEERPKAKYADLDLVILTFSGGAPISERIKETMADCRDFNLETLVLIDKIELSDPILTAKKVEVELALDLPPGRIQFYSEGMTARARDQLLRHVLGRLREKEVALAARLPAVRPLVVGDIIDTAANENAVIGVINFFPGADMPILTANQMRMVLKIAAAYGLTLSLRRAREMLMVMGGGFTFRALARQAAGLVPVAGWAVKGAIAYSGTRTLGYLASRYFEGLKE